MRAKKLFIYGVMFVFFASLSYAKSPAEPDAEILEILNSLDELIVNSNDKPSDSVYKTETVDDVYNFVKSKIDSGEVSIVKDGKMPKDSFEVVGFSFSAKNNDSPTIHFYSEAIKIYKKYPATVYSSVMFAYRQCYDFYNAKSFLFIQENKLEKLLFEMDAHYFQCKFIQTFLVDAEMNPHVYSYQAHKSYVENNLRVFALAFKMVNIDKLYMYLKFSHEHELKETLDFYSREAQNILKTVIIKDGDSKFDIYKKVIEYRTYIEFMPYFVLYVEDYNDAKYANVKELNLKKNYPDIYKGIKSLEKQYKKHSKFIKKIKKELKQTYEF